MPAGQRVADLVRTDKTRAAQDYQTHRFQGSRIRYGRQRQGRGSEDGEPDNVPAVGRRGAHPLPVVIGPMLGSERTERTRAAAFRLMSCRKVSHQMAGGGTFPAARLDPLADDARQISP